VVARKGVGAKTIAMNSVVEERSLAGCCGIFCVLCPRFQSKAPSRCLGCQILCLTISCKIYNCCVKKKGLITCADCEDFPCEKNNPETHQYEYFVTHQSCIQNLRRIKEAGLEVWLEEQRERRLLVEELLDNYNEGRSMSFYCLACTLMPPNLVSKAVDEAREILINSQVDDLDIKAKAKTVKLVIQDLAAQCGIDLKLRKKSK